MASKDAIREQFPGDKEVIETLGFDFPLSVTVIPGAGCVVRVETTTSPLQMIREGTAKWFPWDDGDVSVDTQNGIPYRASGIRFVRVSGAQPCFYEVVK